MSSVLAADFLGPQCLLLSKHFTSWNVGLVNVLASFLRRCLWGREAMFPLSVNTWREQALLSASSQRVGVQTLQGQIHHQVDSCCLADSVESLSHTTSSPQPSPAVSTHASQITDPSFSVDNATTDASAAEETRSESESVFLPDYLFLSNCESGKLSHNRYVGNKNCLPDLCSHFMCLPLSHPSRLGWDPDHCVLEGRSRRNPSRWRPRPLKVETLAKRPSHSSTYTFESSSDFCMGNMKAYLVLK